MKTTDDEIFEFIYERLVEVHGENRNTDYMRRFREAIYNAYENECRLKGLDMFPATEKSTVKAYRLPHAGSPVDILILEYRGNLYSFGATARSAKSVWKEVRHRVDDLLTINGLDNKIEIDLYYVEEFMEDIS